MYNWNLRLSKRVDIWIVVFFWSVSLFNVLANFFVYSIMSSYDLDGFLQGGTIEGGLQKALSTALELFIISGIVTILVMGDRLLAKKKVKSQIPSKFDSEAEKLEFNFRKRNAIRISIFVVITFFSLPWIFAIVGIFISDIPGLSIIFLGRQAYKGFPSVHVGEHHGWDAYLYGVMAIVGSKAFDSKYYVNNRVSRSFLAGGCVFFGLYAFFAGFEDGLNEQLLKRGINVVIYPFFAGVYNSMLFYPILAIISISCVISYYLFITKKQE